MNKEKEAADQPVDNPREEEGKKGKKETNETDGRRAPGTLPPIKDLCLSPSSSPSPSRLLSRKTMDNEDLPLPLPLPTNSESFSFHFLPPGSSPTPPPPSSFVNSLPPQPPPQTPLSPTISSSPTSPPNQPIPPDILQLALKYKEHPEMFFEHNANLDDIIKLMENLPLLVQVFPVRNYYKCKEKTTEVFVYTKKPNIKEISTTGCTKTLNFSGKNVIGKISSGEDIIMYWLDRKKFGEKVDKVDARRFVVKEATAAFTLVVVTWEPAELTTEEKIKALEQRYNHILEEHQLRISVLEYLLSCGIHMSPDGQVQTSAQLATRFSPPLSSLFNPLNSFFRTANTNIPPFFPTFIPPQTFPLPHTQFYPPNFLSTPNNLNNINNNNYIPNNNTNNNNNNNSMSTNPTFGPQLDISTNNENILHSLNSTIPTNSTTSANFVSTNSLHSNPISISSNSPNPNSTSVLNSTIPTNSTNPTNSPNMTIPTNSTNSTIPTILANTTIPPNSPLPTVSIPISTNSPIPPNSPNLATNPNNTTNENSTNSNNSDTDNSKKKRKKEKRQSSKSTKNKKAHKSDEEL